MNLSANDLAIIQQALDAWKTTADLDEDDREAVEHLEERVARAIEGGTT